MSRPLFVAALLALLGPLPDASGQLAISLLSSFVDTQSGGNGNIGVTQDELSGNFYVIDFSNGNTVHEFSPAGTFLSQFPTAACTPAAPSPNDIVWDPITDSLWIVDNGSTGSVTNTSRTGTCLGGFAALGLVNAVGITYQRTSQTLFVSSQSLVTQYDTVGNVLGGGFAFTPATGSAILAGITYVPSLGNFLIVQSSGSSIFEVTPTGTLVSTTDLSSYSITNTQGIHYNHALGTVMVVDNTSSTTYVFSLDCIPSLPYGAGCAGSGGLVPALDVAGCAKLGDTVAVSLSNALGGSTSAMLVSLGQASVPLGGGCTLLVQPTPIAIVIPLGGVGPGAGAFTLPGVIPLTSPIVDVYLQVFVAEPTLPLGLAATNGVKMPIQS